jgi:hypothetical protein
MNDAHHHIKIKIKLISIVNQKRYDEQLFLKLFLINHEIWPIIISFPLFIMLEKYIFTFQLHNAIDII